MSISYKISEGFLQLANALTNEGVKAAMMDGGEDKANKEDVPKSIRKKNLRIKTYYLDGFSFHKFRARGSINRDNKAVIFLPGGGGVQRATYIHYDAAWKVADITGVDVYLVNYPLAPEHNASFALDWLEKFHSKLLKKYDAKNITYMGDSAGANLSLSLTQRVKEKPGKLIIISPACGLEDGKNRNIRFAMEKVDPILCVEMNDMIKETWCKDIPLDSPDISPEYVDYTDFPPIYLLYGEHEIFYPHVLNLVDLMKEKEVILQVDSEPMCHDWALCRIFPEGREAIRKMSEWIMY